ncbi:hypothetical protein AB0C77_37430, partial [Streptomyces sp. NPDC048629]
MTTAGCCVGAWCCWGPLSTSSIDNGGRPDCCTDGGTVSDTNGEEWDGWEGCPDVLLSVPMFSVSETGGAAVTFFAVVAPVPGVEAAVSTPPTPAVAVIWLSPGVPGSLVVTVSTFTVIPPPGPPGPSDPDVEVESVDVVELLSGVDFSPKPEPFTDPDPPPTPPAPAPPPGPSKLVLSLSTELLNTLGTFAGFTFNTVVCFAASIACPAAPNAAPDVNVSQVRCPPFAPVICSAIGIIATDVTALFTTPPTTDAANDCAAFAPKTFVTPAVNALPTPNPIAPP